MSRLRCDLVISRGPAVPVPLNANEQSAEGAGPSVDNPVKPVSGVRHLRHFGPCYCSSHICEARCYPIGKVVDWARPEYIALAGQQLVLLKTRDEIETVINGKVGCAGCGNLEGTWRHVPSEFGFPNKHQIGRAS